VDLINPINASSLGLWLVRAEDEPLAVALQAQLGGDIYRPWLNSELPQKAQFIAHYHQHKQWIFIAATGIAVRYLDGQIQSKFSDPAVVVLDSAGRYAISLLAGHEGGANALAYRVASAIGATPVVTTATEALKSLVVGVGCRKGISAEKIKSAINAALGERSLNDVREIATIDLKANEPGLLEYCTQHNIPLRVFSSQDVKDRPWVTEPSDWVQQNVGVVGVCEPCALMASVRGSLVVSKFRLDGVAVAIVEDKRGFAG
jgi:cobalt-precorrin 5A hydrolase